MQRNTFKVLDKFRNHAEEPFEALAIVDPINQRSPHDPDGFSVQLTTEPVPAGLSPTETAYWAIDAAVPTFTREDTCFSSTYGELALRLLKALALAKTPEEARQVFVGARLFAFSVAKSFNQVDVFDTLPAKRSLEQLGLPFCELRFGELKGVPQGWLGPSAVWVCLDGSACGVGLSAAAYQHFVDTQLILRKTRVALLPPTVRPEILEALVWLSPVGSGGSGGIKASFAPFLDLRFGAFEPRFRRDHWGHEAPPRLVASALAGSRCPSEFVCRLFGLAPLVSAFTDPFPAGVPSASSVVFASFGFPLGKDRQLRQLVAVGVFSELVASLGPIVGVSSDPAGLHSSDFPKLFQPKGLLVAVLFSWRWLACLVGPPLHPVSLSLVGAWLDFADVFRGYEGVPQLALPAQLKAGEPFAPIPGLVRPEWVSEDLAEPGRPKGNLLKITGL